MSTDTVDVPEDGGRATAFSSAAKKISVLDNVGKVSGRRYVL